MGWSRQAVLATYDIPTTIDHELPCVELDQDVLNGALHFQECVHCFHELTEQLLDCPFNGLRIDPYKLACIVCCDINEITFRCKSCRDSNQSTNGPCNEGELCRDLERLIIQQFLELIDHFGDIKLTNLRQCYTVKLLKQEGKASHERSSICAFADKPELR